MKVFTVTKPEPSVDREFQAYVDLLEDIGVDVADAPRTPEPGTSNRWLYVWKSKPQAERFARELGSRLRDPSYFVREFEVPDDKPLNDSHGAIAPLTILSIATSEGTEFRLEPSSQERIFRHFPNVNVVGKVTFPADVRRDYELQHGPVWNQVVIQLCGIPAEAVSRLGGVRILATDGSLVYQRVPALSRG